MRDPDQPRTFFTKVQSVFGEPVPLRIIGRRSHKMHEERRLVWRVLRHWTEVANEGRFPRREEIELWLRTKDGPNCLLIAVESPIELSHFVAVGVNVAIALCHTDTLAGVFLSHLPQVVSARRCLIIEGGATLRGIAIVYRTVLLPVSEDGIAIDYVMGAATIARFARPRKSRRGLTFRRTGCSPAVQDRVP